mgnify:CR=1 FL=1
MEILNIKISKLKNNSGQIAGVKANPRVKNDSKYQKLLKSLSDFPEMKEIRELVVVPYENEFVVVGGNMRLKALKELGEKEALCKVLPDTFTPEQINEFIIKDNLSFGDWDFELLNDWDSGMLEDWGLDLPEWETDNNYGTDFSLPEGDKAPFQQMTFTLADEQAEQIKTAIADIKQTEEYKYAETMGNENSNGNALYLIVMQWAEQRK